MKQHKMIIAAALAGLCTALSPVVHAAADTPADSSGSFTSDAMTTTKVKAALLKEQATRSLSIKVTTVAGVVQLSGSADDAEQIDSAVRIAGAVSGVKDVKNDLQLKQQPAK